MHEKLEHQKKVLLEKISERKRFLSSLPSQLKSLKKASLPVQQQLGILHSKRVKQNQMAELLPLPLYIAYSQLMAQKEAFGERIEVGIVGSMKDAQAFTQEEANREHGITVSVLFTGFIIFLKFFW
jgi:THO complex subunit 5